MSKRRFNKLISKVKTELTFPVILSLVRLYAVARRCVLGKRLMLFPILLPSSLWPNLTKYM